MRLGDAAASTVVKATGVPRIVDATIKDPLTLLAEEFIVEGDFQVPADSLTVRGRTMEILRANLHTPNNATPDSGLTATRITLELAEQLVVSGWIHATDLINIDITQTTGTDAILTFVDGPNSLKTDVGASIRTTAAGSSVTVAAVGSVIHAATAAALGDSSQLDRKSTRLNSSH